MKKFTSPTQKTGEIGEQVACAYLQNKGFQIVERNYTQKWGEIDIIAKREDVVHFIEVKSVKAREFSRETGYRPEENVHFRKGGRLMRTIQTFLMHYQAARGAEPNWQFDVAVVELNMDKRTGRVRMIEDIVLGA